MLRLLFSFSVCTSPRTTAVVRRSILTQSWNILVTGTTKVFSSTKAMAEKEPKWKVIFVLGKPGSGKTTQSQLVAQELGFQHISTGELIRNQAKDDNSEYGAEILKYLNIVPLIPSEISCNLLRQAMEQCTDQQTFIIDGFPRSQENFERWESTLVDQAILQKVVVINCSDQVCRDRCLQVRNREDDSDFRVKDRIKSFSELTVPALETFRTLGLLVEVDGDRKKEEVFADVVEAVSSVGP
ncbi:UMP-CMP kinase 2 [Aplysia californica]|uniref:UMP-CMP kinase 2 n=1 Tax=Aplysia californica TaxID=6500 RepID=A0ABM0K385_APLCA|nr:UMP-CMP kinase 2 [Aplysia californica]